MLLFGLLTMPQMKAQKPNPVPGTNAGPNTKRIQIIHADYLSFQKLDGESIQKLVGNVQILQDSTYFSCDSALQYQSINELAAFGRVLVEMPDSVFLRSNRMRYNGNTRIAKFFDNITLTDSDVSLKTDILVYDRNEESGRYIEGGTLLNGEDTLTSNSGIYYPQQKMAYFNEDVELQNPDYTLTTDTLGYNTELKIAHFITPTLIVSEDGEILARKGSYRTEEKRIDLLDRSVVRDSSYVLSSDTLWYDSEINLGEARGNVFIQQEDSTLEIRGDFGKFKRDTDETWVSDSPVAIQYMDGDTLYMFADTLYSFIDSSEARIFRAYNQVSMYMNDMQAKCDSIAYFLTDSNMVLYHDPILWADENQLTGDTVRVFMKNSKADSMWVGKDGFVASEEDTVGFNQIKGKELRAKFRDNKLSRLKVIGNSQSLYYNQADDGTYEGMNESISQEMTIFLVDNEVQRIRFTAQPDGTYYPIHEVLFDKKELEGLNWRITERPDRPELSMDGTYIPKDYDPSLARKIRKEKFDPQMAPGFIPEDESITREQRDEYYQRFMNEMDKRKESGEDSPDTKIPKMSPQEKSKFLKEKEDAKPMVADPAKKNQEKKKPGS